MRYFFIAAVVTALLALASTSASAQCSGVFSSGNMCANNAATSGLPAQSTATAWLDRWCSSTAGTVPNRAGSWACTPTIALGASGTLGSIQMGNATSGTVTLQPVAGALGSVTASLPANTGTIAEINLSQSWSGTQTMGGTWNSTGTFQAGGNTMTFPGSTATLAALNINDQTLSGGVNVTSNNLGTVSSGTTTVDCGTRPLQYLTNGGAFTLAAPSNDGSCAIQITNNASAGAVTFSGFTVNAAYTGGALDTTNGHKFMVAIQRINGSSIYNIIPQQ